MPPNESSSLTVSRRGDVSIGADLLRTVIWVGGDHDVATRVYLAVTIAQAAVLDDADIVVDLSGVTFMDASTIGTLVDARNRLRAVSRSLSFRAPSPRARRVLDLCGLAQLIDEHPARAHVLAATALGSWVDVPATNRRPASAPPPVEDQARAEREPARVSARRYLAPAVPIQQHRATS